MTLLSVFGVGVELAAGALTPDVFTQMFAWSVGPGRGGGWSDATILAGAALSFAALMLTAVNRRPHDA